MYKDLIVDEEGPHSVNHLASNRVLYHRAHIELFKDIDQDRAKLNP